MRWSARPESTNGWHRAFAWVPLRIDDQWVWLEPYEWRPLECAYECRLPESV